MVVVSGVFGAEFGDEVPVLGFGEVGEEVLERGACCEFVIDALGVDAAEGLVVFLDGTVIGFDAGSRWHCQWSVPWIGGSIQL